MTSHRLSVCTVLVAVLCACLSVSPVTAEAAAIFEDPQAIPGSCTIDWECNVGFYCGPDGACVPTEPTPLSYSTPPALALIVGLSAGVLVCMLIITPVWSTVPPWDENRRSWNDSQAIATMCATCWGFICLAIAVGVSISVSQPQEAELEKGTGANCTVLYEVGCEPFVCNVPDGQCMEECTIDAHCASENACNVDKKKCEGLKPGEVATEPMPVYAGVLLALAIAAACSFCLIVFAGIIAVTCSDYFVLMPKPAVIQVVCSFVCVFIVLAGVLGGTQPPIQTAPFNGQPGVTTPVTAWWKALCYGLAAGIVCCVCCGVPTGIMVDDIGDKAIMVGWCVALSCCVVVALSVGAPLAFKQKPISTPVVIGSATSDAANVTECYGGAACAPYYCNMESNECYTFCSADNQCIDGYDCVSGFCQVDNLGIRQPLFSTGALVGIMFGASCGLYCLCICIGSAGAKASFGSYFEFEDFMGVVSISTFWWVIVFTVLGLSLGFSRKDVSISSTDVATEVTCAAPNAIICQPYVCDMIQGTCLASCDSDAKCSPSTKCVGGACVADADYKIEEVRMPGWKTAVIGVAVAVFTCVCCMVCGFAITDDDADWEPRNFRRCIRRLDNKCEWFCGIIVCSVFFTIVVTLSVVLPLALPSGGGSRGDAGGGGGGDGGTNSLKSSTAECVNDDMCLGDAVCSSEGECVSADYKKPPVSTGAVVGITIGGVIVCVGCCICASFAAEELWPDTFEVQEPVLAVTSVCCCLCVGLGLGLGLGLPGRTTNYSAPVNTSYVPPPPDSTSTSTSITNSSTLSSINGSVLDDGSCVGLVSGRCYPLLCDVANSKCYTECTGNDQCAAGLSCVGKDCVPPTVSPAYATPWVRFTVVVSTLGAFFFVLFCTAALCGGSLSRPQYGLRDGKLPAVIILSIFVAGLVCVFVAVPLFGGKEEVQPPFRGRGKECSVPADAKCSPYYCDMTTEQCYTRCAATTDCGPSYECSDGECVRTPAASLAAAYGASFSVVVLVLCTIAFLPPILKGIQDRRDAAARAERERLQRENEERRAAVERAKAEHKLVIDVDPAAYNAPDPSVPTPAVWKVDPGFNPNPFETALDNVLTGEPGGSGGGGGRRRTGTGSIASDAPLLSPGGGAGVGGGGGGGSSQDFPATLPDGRRSPPGRPPPILTAGGGGSSDEVDPSIVPLDGSGAGAGPSGGSGLVDIPEPSPSGGVVIIPMEVPPTPAGDGDGGSSGKMPLPEPEDVAVDQYGIPLSTPPPAPNMVKVRHTEQTCSICLSTDATVRFVGRQCHHGYCDTCATASLTSILDAGQFPARCPGCRAAEPAPPADHLNSFMNVDTIERLAMRSIVSVAFARRFVNMMILRAFDESEIMSCPVCSVLNYAPDLDAKAASTQPDVLKGTCAECEMDFCLSCNVLYHGHEGISCEEMADKLSNYASVMSATLIEATSKKCPNCGYGITHYKNHACHHIAPGTGCPNCHHHFCYVCLEPNPCSRQGHDLFCDDRCGCPICPDCSPARSCPHCNGDCPACRGTATAEDPFANMADPNVIPPELLDPNW